MRIQMTPVPKTHYQQLLYVPTLQYVNAQQKIYSFLLISVRIVSIGPLSLYFIGVVHVKHTKLTT
jgi:hypothetical protein